MFPLPFLDTLRLPLSLTLDRDLLDAGYVIKIVKASLLLNASISRDDWVLVEPTFMYVNNRLEGFPPGTIAAVIDPFAA